MVDAWKEASQRAGRISWSPGQDNLRPPKKRSLSTPEMKSLQCKPLASVNGTTQLVTHTSRLPSSRAWSAARTQMETANLWQVRSAIFLGFVHADIRHLPPYALPSFGEGHDGSSAGHQSVDLALYTSWSHFVSRAFHSQRRTPVIRRSTCIVHVTCS